MSDLPREIEFELAALADGSLGPERRAQALARVQGSTELQTELAQQERVVALLRAADVEAPESLHHWVSSLGGTDRERRRPRRRQTPSPAWPLLAGAGAALAAVGAVIAVVIGAGSASPSLSDAFAATLRPATLAPPRESSANHTQLTWSVDGVAFPYWHGRFGWRTVGARVDRIGGRLIRTVFYASRSGQRVGYAIMSGPAPTAAAGNVVWRHGVPYRLWHRDGAQVVAWRRGGHACVMSGKQVNARILLDLAGRSESGAPSRGAAT
jgi:hypothetical protein